MVHFVGAGPGAPDLITLRGQALLKEADCVIYAGSLVNPELLQAAKAGCQIHNSAFMTLEEVIAVMTAAEQENKVCVRLHTGDPSIYGAIREQMDELQKRGIPYESCPGVSSMFGASAALNLEYTLPGVSQTVIISRTAGRTPVPERESIRQLAAHQSTMVLFLSAGQMEALSEELTSGGYPPETPAAIVYKASWPEEKTFLCRIENLAETARANKITKTALVIVGNVLQGAGQRSKLYDPTFSTEFRAAAEPEQQADKMMSQNAALASFTQEGTQLAQGIADYMEQEGWDCRVWSTHKGREGGYEVIPLQEGLQDWAGKRFADSRALVFVGASGIAVRAIAPFVKDKLTDPAVLVVDEAAKHVIPLLSGHVGGANRLAKDLSDHLGADPVLTTATDVRGRFAVDTFAAENGLVLTDRVKAKKISADILAGQEIGISGPEGWLGKEDLPHLIRQTDEADAARILIDWRQPQEDEKALRLIPEKSVWIGIGCKKGTSEKALEEAFEEFLQSHRIDPRAVAGLASISLKKEEKGLLALADKLQLPLRFYEADQLEGLAGDFSESAFVREQTGTGNVCERAACLAAWCSGERDSEAWRSREQDSEAWRSGERDFAAREARDLLIVKKEKADGITLAAALAYRRLKFE